MFIKVVLAILSLISLIASISLVVYRYSNDAAFGFGFLAIAFVVVLLVIRAEEIHKH